MTARVKENIMPFSEIDPFSNRIAETFHLSEKIFE